MPAFRCGHSACVKNAPTKTKSAGEVWNLLIRAAPIESATQEMPTPVQEKTNATPALDRSAGPWDPSLEQLREWDPPWAETCVKMTTNPWIKGVLPRKTVELICVALNAACTNLNPDGTRRHIRAALEAGASRHEILMILKMASVMSIHSCSLGTPILREEAKAAGVQSVAHPKNAEPTPACDKMRALGQWNQAWEPFYELDPVWTDQFMTTGIGIYVSGLMTPKLIELLSIAFEASLHPHVFARHAPPHQGSTGTRRHGAGNHGGAQTMRRPRGSGMQSRRTDPVGRGRGF
jgi:alkylhydroperoxidase/carboxymuconolactone decarboxylase family protein YurZ